MTNSPFDKLFKRPTTRRAIATLNNTLVDKLFEYDFSKLHSITDTDIDKIINDLTVLQADESRKSVTEKKEIQIVTDNEEYKEIVKDMFSPEIISQILDTYMYGFNVFEVNYIQKGTLFIPELIQRDFRDFIYQDNELVYARGGYTPIESYKIITATYRKRFNKQYGDGILSKIYFPVKLKNASLDFWVRFLEKFGSPWAIGKSDIDADELANEVNAMLNGDTAIIDPEESIELVHPSGNKGDFDKLIDYCDSQINRAILGANLTGEVKGGSHAAASVHNDIREDIANVDKKILEYVLNKAVKYFKEVNGIDEEIYVKFQDEDDPKNQLAQRDKIIFDMGYKPTLEYIKNTYNIDVIEDSNQTENKLFLNSVSNPIKNPLKDKIETYTDSIDTQVIEDEILKEIMDILNSANSYEELQDKLLSKYKDLDFSKLQELLEVAIHNSHLQGSLDVGNDK
jgi:phage gp29-like protein